MSGGGLCGGWVDAVGAPGGYAGAGAAEVLRGGSGWRQADCVSQSSQTHRQTIPHRQSDPPHSPPCEPILTKSRIRLVTTNTHPTNPIKNWLGHKIADWTDSVMDFKQSARHNDA